MGPKNSSATLLYDGTINNSHMVLVSADLPALRLPWNTSAA
jgi:hypothetical protein